MPAMPAMPISSSLIASRAPPRTSATTPSRRTCLRYASVLIAAQALPAQALDVPSGPIELTLTGRLRKPNTGDRALFDMPMLAGLTQQSFTARTPWYAQARKFTGPLLRDVLTAAGAQGKLLRLSAVNDYRAEMPLDDAMRFDVIVARLLDDQPMGVRDKGPLFVVYPFDSRSELRSALYFSRSVWQLRTIEVL
jgi:hypothetical protein